MKKRNKNAKMCLGMCLAGALSLAAPMHAMAASGWVEQQGKWRYYQAEQALQLGWLKIGNDWYYFDSPGGEMKTGWFWSSDKKWYFLDNSNGSEQGKMLKGWQWIDGYCYYFDPISGNMLSDTTTPDGYTVNADGHCLNESGLALFTRNKGYQTNTNSAQGQNTGQERGASRTSRGGGSSSRGGGGSSRGDSAGTSDSSRTGDAVFPSRATSQVAAHDFGLGGKVVPEDAVKERDFKNQSSVIQAENPVNDEKKYIPLTSSETLEDPAGVTSEALASPANAAFENSSNTENADSRPAEAVSGEHAIPSAPSESVEETVEEFEMDISEDFTEKRKGNIAQYTDENGQARHIYWVQGITPPVMGENGDFHKEVTMAGGNTFIEYTVTQQDNASWFDVNKAYADSAASARDRNLCFAATASNMLHWWMEQNHERIGHYIERHGDAWRRIGAKSIKLSDYVDSFRSQQDSEIFEMFKMIYGYRADGFNADILADLFINGYTPKERGGTNVENDNLIPDGRGGFFYDVFKGKKLTTRSYRGRYEDLSGFLREELQNGNILGIEHTVFGGSNHIITLWGAEYDENNRLIAIYVTDSDDQNDESTGMKRYNVYNVGGYAKLTTNVTNKSAGSSVNMLHSLSLGEEEWNRYLNEN